MKVKTVIVVCLIMLISRNLWAQGVPPALFVTDSEFGEKSTALAITGYRLDLNIAGLSYNAACTMTFYNPGGRAVAGDFYFPLPEDAVVSGYALDIGGVLVDGVPVPKPRARQVFEKIVRQGIDPGLVEWTKGNTFKTRIFPIPARGSRTVRVRFTGVIAGGGSESVFRFPISITEKVKDVSVSVYAGGFSAAPSIVESPVPGLGFKAAGSGYTAAASASGIAPGGSFTLRLSVPTAVLPIVEKDAEGNVFFTLTDLPPASLPSERLIPKRIMIYWDASGSRAGQNLSASLALLESYLNSLGGNEIEIILDVLRNTAEERRIFRTGGVSSAARAATAEGVQGLLAFLRNLPYDGGTALSALKQPPQGTDLAFLFSDGISTFGEPDLPLIGVPLYCFAEGAAADYGNLRALAVKSGGESFNLNTASVRDVSDRIGRLPLSFLGIRAVQGRVDESYPRTPEPVTLSFRLTGRLLTPGAVIALQYGRKGIVERENLVTIPAAVGTAGAGGDASKGGRGFVSLLWAQAKLKELMLNQERNKALITDLGKEYGLVTPGTSLLVLENLEQYVEFRIQPPETLPDMRKAYLSRIAELDRSAVQEQTQKLKALIPKWQELVRWWNTKFEYPPNFRYREAEPKKSAEMEGGNGGERDDLSMRSMEERPAPSPEPSGIASGTNRPEAPESMAKAISGKDDEPSAEPEISIQAWDPDTPYLAVLKKTQADRLYEVYMEQRKKFAESPAFYLDCADYFMEKNLRSLGLRILSNLAELKLEDAPLLRILAHRLSQVDELSLSAVVFEEVLAMRPEEPQSWRDLALVLGRLGEYGRAVELLYKVVMGTWDRFEDIELMALTELNSLLPKARAAGQTVPQVDERLVKLLDADVRITLTWDTDLSDMDLWITEPSAEKAYYAHNLTTIGGRVSRDFTQGYGPEEYFVRKAMKGPYKIEVNYYSSSAPSLSGSVTLQVEVFTNFGRANEKRQALTVRLRESSDTVYIGEIRF